MIKVRNAFETDIPQILDIEHESFFPPWTHGALLSEIYNDDSFFALACENDDEGSVLGFIILRCCGDEAQLLQIAVCSGKRRRGVADMLMDAALGYVSGLQQTAAESEVKIFLEVRESNVAAINLYQKHGFITVAVRKKYYTNPMENAAVMMRNLLNDF